MLQHLAVAAMAAVVTAVITPLVARLARRLGATVEPYDEPTLKRPPVPVLGGLAMFAGFLAAIGLAWFLPEFQPLFDSTSEPLALLVGAAIIVAVGLFDDLFELPPTVKLAGQIVAALGVVGLGIQLVYFWVPGLDVLALSPDLGLPLTIIALVAMVNALNLIDGLDGLAAGIALIGASAFFLFAVRSQPTGLIEAGVPTSATLVAALVAGMAAGFLVHNWFPAKIIMGDTGAMLLGLLLGSAGVAYAARSTAPSSADFYGAMPLLIPVLVLVIPFLDSSFAVIRRTLAGRPITAGDRGHLHHLLMAFGHSHRRAVMVLYYWSAVLAFGSVGPAFLALDRLLPWLAVAVAMGIAITALGVRSREELLAAAAPEGAVSRDPHGPDELLAAEGSEDPPSTTGGTVTPLRRAAEGP
ncbi:MAG: undecaprenyl/decaprenyl-phosphate alpha-N-acetylglucosaminyl 1-phosphate transferase [Nitriliruptoraceae bacterium]|nr:undecaprenyl/decaprenyl-phosphate alpha-N-acetylglucosaminyl 1-phosphate transferase [Nitriliruptoraceae bacterium]